MVKENPGYEYAYGWNRFNMGVVGAWPEKDQNFFLKNRALMNAFIVFALVWLPMTASLVFLRDDLNELIGCLVINVPVGMSVYKLVLFRVRRNAIEVFLSAMADDWAVARSSEERKVMMEKARYGRLISIMSVTVAISMFLAFSSVGSAYTYQHCCAQMSLYWAWAAAHERHLNKNETRLAVGLLYTAYFPYDTRELRVYLLTWLGQLFATLVSMIGYSGPDSAMSMMILHLCGQLGTVRIALANIVDEKCIKDPSIYWERLSSIIERHEQLNRCAELLEGSFNLMLLTQMVLCTITFCFQGFVTIMTVLDGLTGDADFPFLAMTFVVIQGLCTILHLFVTCWTGDLLVSESTTLSYAPYESDWYRMPPTEAKALMMVTSRCRIPLQITAGKFIGFSLELFTSIMKTSMGYLSVLLAMKES